MFTTKHGGQMKTLIIGGTEFVGKHISEAAEKAGHEVTLFNRGITSPETRFDHIKGNVENIVDQKIKVMRPCEHE